MVVARVARAHGVRGELACEILTEFPERFARTRRVFLARGVGDGVHREQRRVERARLAGTQVLLKLQGIDDRDAAEAQRGAMVEVPEREAWKLPRGRFYWHQIIGLRVRTPEGRELGTVKEILETGANDVYVVDTERGEMLVPAIKDVVKGIAPHRGVMTVEPLPGMEPEDAGRTKDERRRTRKRPRRRETDKPS